MRIKRKDLQASVFNIKGRVFTPWYSRKCSLCEDLVKWEKMIEIVTYFHTPYTLSDYEHSNYFICKECCPSLDFNKIIDEQIPKIKQKFKDLKLINRHHSYSYLIINGKKYKG